MKSEKGKHVDPIIAAMRSVVWATSKDDPESVKEAIFSAVVDQHKVLSETTFDFDFPAGAGLTEDHKQQIRKAVADTLKNEVTEIFKKVVAERIKAAYSPIVQLARASHRTGGLQ